MNEWKVILIRQPFQENVTYKCVDKPAASTRAYMLSQQHPHCNIAVINSSRRIWVYASAFYARKD
jgi:hypothetical protein